VKFTRLAELPRILVLHIQRSVYTMRGSSKCTDSVGISTRLCVDAWRTCLRGEGASRYFGGEGECGWIGGDEASSTVEEIEQSHHIACMYDLIAVICHYGTHENGHYICFKKVDKKWFRISDAHVREVRVDQVVEEGSAYCFMLFYEQDGGKSAGASAVKEERVGLAVLHDEALECESDGISEKEAMDT
jgi:hypothetical protein